MSCAYAYFKLAGITVALLLSAGCHKDKITVPAIAPLQPDTANYINGALRKYVQYNYSPGMRQHEFQYVFGSCFFNAAPFTTRPNASVTYSFVNAGTVTMDNRDALSYDTRNYPLIYYQDVSDVDMQQPLVWNVSGNAALGMPAFNSVSNLAFPGYEGALSLPDTIYKKKDLTLHLNKIANAERVKVYLTNYFSSTIIEVTKEIVLNGSSSIDVSFTASELSVFRGGYYTALDIYFFNDQIVNANNKNFRVSKIMREYVTHIYFSN